MYKMAQEILKENATVSSVTYRLPNKHYVPVNLTFFKLENMTPPEKAEVFTPLESPRLVALFMIRRLSCATNRRFWVFVYLTRNLSAADLLWRRYRGPKRGDEKLRE